MSEENPESMTDEERLAELRDELRAGDLVEDEQEHHLKISSVFPPKDR